MVLNPGIILAIQPGTIVKFDSGKLLAVRGTLIADGTPGQPILFTAWNPPNGEWGGSYQGSPSGGIVFTADSQPAQFDSDGNYLNGSIIRYATVEYSVGGIQLQSAVPFIDHNLIQKNRDMALGCSSCPSQLVISHNRIINNNATYILNLVTGQANIRQNLIANNTGGVRVVQGHEIISNTISGNTGTWCSGSAPGVICLQGPGATPTLRGNNIVGNPAPFDIEMGTMAGQIGDVNAPGNYWGTTDAGAIRRWIYDFNQDSNASVFTFTPFLTAPNTTAPLFLDQLSLSPGSPVGIQQTAFNLNFSAPMDQSINPVAKFYSAKRNNNDIHQVQHRQWIAI